ncbi:MAG: Ig-like domain-containing protein, partial [Anaerolineaceae bacterium]|nr:Ig-like domain-containing protein [Anaerolineaceae bacterium]
MNKNLRNCLVVFAITGGIIVVVAGVVWGVMWLLSNQGEPPVVSIILPAESVTLSSGQGVALFVAAQAPGGIERIDFFVNNQLENTAPAPGEGDMEMDTAFPWLSSATGIHKLSVIAYDSSGRASPPDDLMVAVLALPVEADDSDYAFQLDHPSQILPEGSGVPEDQAGDESGEVQGIAGVFPPFEGNPDGVPFGQQVPRDELDEVSDLLDNSRPDDDFPQEFDDSLSDEPPTILLQVDVPRGAGAHILYYTIVAEDDLGVMEILVWYVRPGQPEITLQHDCMGELTCSRSGEIELDANVQQHGISAAAVDISGQMSEVAMEQIQLLDNENGLFAGLAIEPLDGHVPQALANPFINNPGELAQQGLSPGDFIDPDALAELDLDPDEPAEVEDDGCLMLYARQSPEGIRLQAVVMCDIRALGSNELHFEFERLADVNQQQVIQPLNSSAIVWDQMMDRQLLAPGDFFTYVDTLQACWVTYTYRVGLSQQAAGTQENGLFDPNLTSTELVLTTQACSGDVFAEGISLNV